MTDDRPHILEHFKWSYLCMQRVIRSTSRLVLEGFPGCQV